MTGGSHLPDSCQELVAEAQDERQLRASMIVPLETVGEL